MDDWDNSFSKCENEMIDKVLNTISFPLTDDMLRPISINNDVGYMNCQNLTFLQDQVNQNNTYCQEKDMGDWYKVWNIRSLGNAASQHLLAVFNFSKM